jgi:nucleoside-diphosphate-sugar epimerase
MSLYVVTGAGPIGSTIATALAGEGHEVRQITRSGGGPVVPGVERIAADATDRTKLADLAKGAEVIYNCTNPDYTRWAELWPPLAESHLFAAEASGATLAIMGNLYGYGPVDEPMTEDLPLAPNTVKGRVRADMWHAALAAHRAGRIRVTEVRGSDYIGPGGRSMLTELVLPALLAGKKTVRVPAALDAPHSFTYTRDAARTLLTLGRDERAWGRAWHVPTAPPLSIRELVNRAVAILGRGEVKLRRVPGWQVGLAKLVSRDIRAFSEMSYQFDRPFVVDSSRVRATFGIEATPIEEALRAALNAGTPGAAGAAARRQAPRAGRD